MSRLLVLLFVLLGFNLSAQLSYGFEVGLNFSSFNGPSELDPVTSAELESFKTTNTFHVGGNLRYKFIDRFGVKAEILYSQKGGKTVFDGQGIQVFTKENGDKILSAGMRSSVISVTNSYIDIPVTAYYRPVSRIELFAGANVGFLINSIGVGELNYSGQTSLGGDQFEFLAELDHNYNKDLGRNETTIEDFQELISFEIDGNEVTFPQSLGAYYMDFDTKGPGDAFNKLDVGLVGGAHFYFNGSLYLGVRVNYGLLDVTNNDFDVSRTTSNGVENILRDDIDRNLSIQASLGFNL